MMFENNGLASANGEYKTWETRNKPLPGILSPTEVAVAQAKLSGFIGTSQNVTWRYLFTNLF
uniref:Uncharacterized protein n=1 Tax=Anguilla anguilla TaxID=7936 RepID=A0A0E9WQM3_ANGAN